jgi:hypothetical protein
MWREPTSPAHPGAEMDSPQEMTMARSSVVGQPLMLRASRPHKEKYMKIKTKVRAGALTVNRNGVKVKTKVRAGALTVNRNVVRV